MQAWQRDFADALLEAGALRLGSFRLKSGRLSPLFLDAGRLDTGPRLARLGGAYAEALLERIGPEGFDVVFGPAYKGIPLAVATVLALAERGVEKPFLADRKEAKRHGAEAGSVAERLLGRPPAADARFVMVDDVVTTGGTKHEALALLGAAAPRGRTVALLVVLDRQELGPDGEDAALGFTARTQVPVLPLLELCPLIDYLEERGALAAGDRERCTAYWGEHGTALARAWALTRRAGA
jgi:orotate phosphoribosyltransferase